MNELLVSELSSDKKSLLHSLVLIEEFVFSEMVSQQSLDVLIADCRAQLKENETTIERAEHLLNVLFLEQMYIDKDKAIWPSSSFLLANAVNFREISPVLKAVIFRHIFEACDFDADIVFVPEKVMIRVSCDEVYGIVFDPITGESIDGYQLHDRLAELEGDPSQLRLNAMAHDTLIIEHLTALKSALILEKKFDQALKCVDILIALRPNDPFERRDRGFLLHQLDCFKVAYDDYQYFVEQCPKDPAAQLLKLQLERISLAEPVVH